ncbi:MAG: SAM-dependent methyltransferase [Bacteroidales bacterium]|nr:SAM-dependent methyltransferase [Bacteroidales bacterium]
MLDITPTAAEKQFAADNADADVRGLALRLKEAADFRPKYVLQQIAGRQMMRRKMCTWAQNPDIVYPVHLSVEQCSSEFTANYKRKIVERLCHNWDANYADFTGGFGVDFSVMSQGFAQTFYIEQNEELCEIAQHNFNTLGLKNYNVINGDGVDFLKNFDGTFGAVFIDPARRNSAGAKTVHIGDCVPNIIDFQDVLVKKSDVAIVKLSPMLDIAECTLLLKNIVEIHVVAVDGECKEILVVLSSRIPKDEPTIFAANNNQIFSFVKSDEQNCAANIAGGVGEGMYLYEPNAALMKTAPFMLIANRYQLKKISRNSHLYVSDTPVENFPGRTFRIVRIGSMKDFKDIDKANITVRNFPIKADDIRKKLKIKDGGDVYIFATTLADGSKVLMETRKYNV